MTREPMRFDGRVAIVTGSGRNLGREYALALATRGAHVVVNDLGVGISDSDGIATAPDANPAFDVVAEIIAAGGTAIANTDSVTTSAGGRAIVQAAIDEFGTVDIVVNNAGQVRMAPFADLPDASIDALIDTQLRGPLNVGRPAWEVMAAKGYGRIVNVSSGAAFGGVPGGSAYAMAKMGTVGLTRGMASEARKLGIRVNVVAPYAKTRPGSGMGPWPWSAELAEWLHPRLVAPLVLYLAHEDCTTNGEWFTVGAGHVARVGLTITDGVIDRSAEPETIGIDLAAILNGERHALDLHSPGPMPAMMHGFGPPSGRERDSES